MVDKFKITDVQLFEKVQKDDEGNFTIRHSYFANLIIDNSFIVKVSGNSDSACFDGIAPDANLEAILEKDGFENNIGWLEDHATLQIMLPENEEI